MVAYDYICKDCGEEFEVSHSMTASPKIACRKCGSGKTVKAIRACGIIARNSDAQRRFDDAVKQGSDRRQDLKENYGVESITPVATKSMAQVYNDIKASGTLVRDQMQARKEQNAKATKAKQRAWAIKANKRVAERTRIVNEKRAEEAAGKRAIHL